MGARSGWRYVASPAFRRKTHARWKDQSVLRVLWDVVRGIAGIALTLLLLYVLISLFAGWDWIQKLAAA
jgi:hypothetical protein